MANREYNTRNDEWYWKQTEIVRRFEALRKDFADMIGVHTEIALKKVKAGRWDVRDAELYAEGLEDACTEMDFCLQTRFSEIARILSHDHQVGSDQQRPATEANRDVMPTSFSHGNDLPGDNSFNTERRRGVL